VLHVVMPHNGVDLAAPTGAPVYATAAGVVTSVGLAGPCGNRVEIEHAHGITSVYCHLSHFAAGLRAGQRVEQRQLIAYVGQTGRVTGPHLHFGVRRGDVFIDPMTLRLDGVRVVPRGQRDQFDRLRGELDGELDAIALPAPPSAATSVETPETEPFYEEPP
ncbi:MAG: M23 family metallopeptidase, partial [Myxococcota bacterium]|nr:M23 family metallopeptidase [Myxococcota bacterium]